MSAVRKVDWQEIPQVEALRAAMVGELRELGAIRSDRVADAFGVVPRHLFCPGEPLERAYDASATVLTKRDERGVAVSTVSAPHIQAMMLEQAQMEPGMRVLEVGSGGYNAALIAELVGEAGEVTTVDIDPDVVARARDCLAAAGYDRVNVVLGDAEDGVPDHAPYDRVVVTAGTWDIPPTWPGQLADDGWIVVPLRMRGQIRSVVFERDGDVLVSRGYELCRFVPMLGAGAHGEAFIPLAGQDVTLRLDEGERVDADRLRDALSHPRVEAWSGVTVAGDDRFDGLHLWLALTLQSSGILMAGKDAVDRGVVAHAWPLGIPTAVEGGSLAYLGLRPVTPDRTMFEFGAYGNGADAQDLLDRVVEQIRSWDGGSLNAGITAYPAGTPDDQLPEGAFVLDKRHTRVAISWPGRSALTSENA